jgi:hypothetical protein
MVSFGNQRLSCKVYTKRSSALHLQSKGASFSDDIPKACYYKLHTVEEQSGVDIEPLVSPTANEIEWAESRDESTGFSAFASMKKGTSPARQLSALSHIVPDTVQINDTRDDASEISLEGDMKPLTINDESMLSPFAGAKLKPLLLFETRATVNPKGGSVEAVLYENESVEEWPSDEESCNHVDNTYKVHHWHVMAGASAASRDSGYDTELEDQDCGSREAAPGESPGSDKSQRRIG